MRIVCALDGVLAHAGNSQGPIGEMNRPVWDFLMKALERGSKIEIVSWREPGTVNAWIEAATRMSLGGLIRTYRFRTTKEFPAAIPDVYLMPDNTRKADDLPWTLLGD